MSLSLRRRRSITAVITGLVSVGAMFAVQMPASAATSVTVNGGQTFQRIDGFGVSEAFGMANAIRELSGSARRQALDMLFSTTNGAGFSILRNDIPSGSDSIEPHSPGSPLATPTYVWNPSDDGTEDGQLWLARQAKSGYGVSTIYNNAWTPPSFMTSSGNGGGLCGVPGVSCSSGDWRRAYADYLTQDTKFWASAGLTPSAVGFVNEPSTGGSSGSMLFTPSQAANFLSVLAPTMKSSGLSTRIACCDTLGFNQLPGYVSAVGSGAGLFTSHGYSSAPTTPISTGGRPVWESEWSVNGSTWDAAWDDGSEGAGFTWAQRAHTALTGANVNAFLYFWGISTTNHDSSLIGLRGSTLNASKRYDALANYSRFIRPGATRIAATSGNGLDIVAFKNTDGSIIVVALNTNHAGTSATYTVTNAGLSSGTVTPYLTNAGNSTAAQATIRLASGAFTATVPARSLVTFRITG